MDAQQAIEQLLSQQKTSSASKTPLQEKVSAIFRQMAGNTSADHNQQVTAEGVMTQLAEAAQAKQSELFQNLVQAEQSSGKVKSPTLLMAAVLAQEPLVVEAMIAAGADIHASISEFLMEMNALDMAVGRSNLEIVRMLLEAGADPNWQHDVLLTSPIFKAIKANNSEMLALLLKYGASVQFDRGLKPLQEAVQKDNPEIIDLLLAAGCDINETDFNGRSALQQACLHCSVEVIKRLLAAGSVLSSKQDEIFLVFSAPFLAEQLGEPDPTPRIPDTIQVLIDVGVEINLVARNGATPLALAIKYGYLGIVKLLLAGGAQPNQTCRLSRQFIEDKPELEALMEAYTGKPTFPLHVAAAFGQGEIVQALLAASADNTLKDIQGRTALDIAISEGRLDIIQLLSPSANTNTLSTSVDALLGAAKRGNLSVLQSALAADVDPNSSQFSGDRSRRYKTALMFAAEVGHLEAVQLLLAQGADVNLSDRPGKRFGKTPLMYAAESNHANVIEQLLAAGAIVDAQDKRGQTALFYAVQEESAEAVAVLLQAGADVHKQSWDGSPFYNATYASDKITKLITAASQPNTDNQAALSKMLSSAAFNGNITLVRDLIQQGVDVNIPEENDGWTALMYAAAQGPLTIVQLLLAAGAEPDLDLPSGQTALTEAAYWGHAEVVQTLISAGANVNAADAEGETPLMKAASFGRTEVLEILIAAGADLTLRNNDEQTALGVALDHREIDAVKMLRRFGTKR